MLRLMLSLLLAAAALTAADAAESRRAVECPELVLDEVCSEVQEPGFTFSNGCNRIRCLANGLAVSTRRSCPPAESPEERAECRRAARKVFDRVGPLTCANVEPQRVCTSRGGGFRFSDGCNGIVCAEDGSVASSTMRSCPYGEPEGAYCRFVEESIGDSQADEEGGDDESSDRSGQRRRRSQQEFACPQLAASAICQRSTNGFSYSDGCNSITCHMDGTGQSTFKFCPAPEASDAAGRAYCQQAERDMRAKMQRASLRSRCLEAANVCQGENVRQVAYNNGCNRCFCTGPGEDACTRRSCPKVLMTDEEFASYCKDRGAGIH